MDRSSNRVVAAALALTLTAGVVHSGPAQGSTAVAPMPRSALGPLLQRDPNRYQDSVNQWPMRPTTQSTR